jgi:predicted MFS family arabinose efflux permease
MAEFDIGLSSSGMLMSVYGLTGLVLTLPAGFVMQRLGMKAVSIIAFGCMIAGAALGALSRGFGMLLFSRMLEGVGNVLIFIMTPALIAMWFPPARRGLPMGIWASSTPVGNILTWLVIPRLVASIGWRGAWWVSGAFTALIFILFWVLMRPAPVEDRPAGRDLSKLKDLLRSKSIWLVSLSWFFWIAVQTSLYTFYPTFLTGEAGFSMVHVGSLFSLVSMIRMINNPLSGWLSDLIGSRKVVAVVGASLYLPIFVLLFRASPEVIPALMLLMGFFSSVVPVMIMASVPDATGDPALAPMGMAIVQFGFNVSISIGSPVFGGLVERTSWSGASMLFAPLILFSMIAIVMNKKVR